MLLLKGCRLWTSSSLLRGDPGKGTTTPLCLTSHSPWASTSITWAHWNPLVLLVLHGQSEHSTLAEKNGSITPCPAQAKLQQQKLGHFATLLTLPFCISSLHFICSLSIKLHFHLLKFSCPSLAFQTHACENRNCVHLQIKLKWIHMHTEILAKQVSAHLHDRSSTGSL